MSVDVEDWFQVENLRPSVSRRSWTDRPLRVEANTDRILDIFDRTGTIGTFFCLGWVAERLPALIRRIADQGHEIASHGYSHRLVYEQTHDEFREDVYASRMLLEDTVGLAVRGYRAPSFSITPWAYPILERAGYAYDSSTFPVRGHDRYGSGPGRPDTRVRQLPLTTLDVGGKALPWAGGGYFRLYPAALFRVGFARAARRSGGAVFYLHPWEVDPDQPRVHGLPRGYRFRHYVNLRRTAGRLEAICRRVRFGRADVALGLAPPDRRG